MNVDIKRISETETGGAWVMAYIPRFTEVKQYFTNNMAKAWLEIDDNRRISADQRKKIYALFGDIANYTGHFREEIKDIMKTEFIELNGRDYFSLANLDQTHASNFIEFILEFCFQYNIPFKTKTADLMKDFIKWQYYCVKYKKCCICGKNAEIEHYDTIGMGNNRKTLDDSNKRKMALCRIHHTEIHTMPKEKFCDKYHVTPIIYNIKEG